MNSVTGEGVTNLITGTGVAHVTAGAGVTSSFTLYRRWQFVLNHWHWYCMENSRCGRHVFNHWSRRCKNDGRCGRHVFNHWHCAAWKASGAGATFLITGAGVAAKVAAGGRATHSSTGAGATNSMSACVHPLALSRHVCRRKVNARAVASECLGQSGNLNVHLWLVVRAHARR